MKYSWVSKWKVFRKPAQRYLLDFEKFVMLVPMYSSPLR